MIHVPAGAPCARGGFIPAGTGTSATWTARSSMSRNYKTCSTCRNDKETTNTGKIKRHNRWDARKRKMVPCEGSLKMPVARTVAEG